MDVASSCAIKKVSDVHEKDLLNSFHYPYLSRSELARNRKGLKRHLHTTQTQYCCCPMKLT